MALHYGMVPLLHSVGGFFIRQRVLWVIILVKGWRSYDSHTRWSLSLWRLDDGDYPCEGVKAWWWWSSLWRHYICMSTRIIEASLTTSEFAVFYDRLLFFIGRLVSQKMPPLPYSQVEQSLVAINSHFFFKSFWERRSFARSDRRSLRQQTHLLHRLLGRQ